MRSQYTVELEPELIAHYRNRARGNLQYDLNGRIPPRLNEAERSGFSDFLAMYGALVEKLDQHVNGELATEVKGSVIRMYAVDVAAQYAMKRNGLEDKGYRSLSIMQFGGGEGMQYQELFEQPFQEYLLNGPDEREDRLGSLLRGFSTTARTSVKAKKFKDACDYLKDLRIQLNGEGYAAFAANGDGVVIDLPRRKERMIGNEEMAKGLDGLLSSLTYFDGTQNQLWMRGVKVPKTANIYGKPGVGKTLGIRLAFQRAKEIWEPQMSVPLRLRYLDNSFKDSLFSKSASNLNDLFTEIRDSSCAYVIVADDIESIFHDRQNSSHNPEEKNIMHTLLNQLDGLLDDQKGNYVFISTSNHPLSIDPALDSRLSELLVRAPGPQNPAEYAAIFKELCMDQTSVDWPLIGDAAYTVELPGEGALSGRHIKDILTNHTVRYILPGLAADQRILADDELDRRLAELAPTTEQLLGSMEHFEKEKQIRFVESGGKI